VLRGVVLVLIFGGSAAAMMALHLPGFPRAQSDRWVVSMAVATFLATLAITCMEWWRRRGGSESEEGGAASGVRQRLSGRHDSVNILSVGDVNTTGHSASGPSGANPPKRSVDQRVRAGRRSRNILSGGSVTTSDETRE